MEIIDAESGLSFDRDFDELPDLRLLSQHRLLPGAKVLNIGANQGLLAMMLARIVAPTGFVWAIEPDERRADAARRNLQLNLINNCYVVRADPADPRGIEPAFILTSDEQRMTLVPASVDALAATFGLPDVVTIDVPGRECIVLQGSRETLRSGVTDFFIEVRATARRERKCESLKPLLSFFPAKNYRLMVRDVHTAIFRDVQAMPGFSSEHFVLIALAHTLP